jgi:hypothetical protein
MRFDDLDMKRKEVRVSAKAAKTGVVRFVPMPYAFLAWLEGVVRCAACGLARKKDRPQIAQESRLIHCWL